MHVFSSCAHFEKLIYNLLWITGVGGTLYTLHLRVSLRVGENMSEAIEDFAQGPPLDYKSSSAVDTVLWIAIVSCQTVSLLHSSRFSISGGEIDTLT